MRDEMTLTRTLEALEGTAPARSELVAEFERVVGAHYGKILNVARQVLTNEEDAKESAQEALRIAYCRLSTFRGDSQLSTWLCGIAYNVARDRARRKAELLTLDGIVDPSCAEADVLRQLARAERAHVLAQIAKDCLDPTDQEIAHLRYVEGLPRSAIVQLLELESPRAVTVALQRIGRRMGKKLLARLAELGVGLSFVRTEPS